jgi:hypothetical protein
MTGVTLGIEDEDPAIAAITVYPNPSTGIVQVSGNYKTLTVSDITGRTVYYQQSKAQVNTVNLQQLPAGMYTFRIDTGKTSITRKIIKL